MFYAAQGVCPWPLLTTTLTFVPIGTALPGLVLCETTRPDLTRDEYAFRVVPSPQSAFRSTLAACRNGRPTSRATLQPCAHAEIARQTSSRPPVRTVP